MSQLKASLVRFKGFSRTVVWASHLPQEHHFARINGKEINHKKLQTTDNLEGHYGEKKIKPVGFFVSHWYTPKSLIDAILTRISSYLQQKISLWPIVDQGKMVTSWSSTCIPIWNWEKGVPVSGLFTALF